MKSIIVSMAAAAGFVIAGSALAQDMPPLAKELNCTACHAIDHKVVGPAWRDVANRYTGKGVKTYTYRGKEYPLIEGLVMKVSKGGAGNWGSMPMPANDLSGAKIQDRGTGAVRTKPGNTAGQVDSKCSIACKAGSLPALFVSECKKKRTVLGWLRQESGRHLDEADANG